MRHFRRFVMPVLFLAVLLLAVSPAGAVNSIRVLLQEETRKVQFAVVQGKYQLVDNSTGQPVTEAQPGELWTVFRENYNVTVRRQGDSDSFTLKGGLRLTPEISDGDKAMIRFAGKLFPGDLCFWNTGDRLLVINEVDVEDYLCGVLAQEMTASFPLEALKAQAVVSRTLAMYRISDAPYYDVVAEISDQVYRGYPGDGNIPDSIREAVESTAGEMIFYDGSLVEAVFHSNAGGYTASSESIWGGYRPYLQSVASPYDVYALEYPRQSAGWPANTYEWSKTYSTDEINRLVNSWNASHPDTIISVGTVLELRIDREKPVFQVSGPVRIKSLELVGDRGSVFLSGEEARKLFGLRSSMFTVTGGGSLALLSKDGYSQSKNLSGLAVIAGGGDIVETGKDVFAKGQDYVTALSSGSDSYTFSGRGYGHGVGMSQWGAIGMAAAGYNYQEIIEHYYNQGKYDGRLQIKR